MIDTAGRLPTQQHLMEELRKIRRVLGKAMDGAPHEVLLVLDGNTGQNMLAQVKAFDEAVQLTGLIVTKLDGTAKGGAIAALAFTRREQPIPVYFIGDRRRCRRPGGIQRKGVCVGAAGLRTPPGAAVRPAQGSSCRSRVVRHTRS